MTSKERIIAAMNKQPVDMVPCYPNVSFLVPARKSGRPFWASELDGNVNLDDIKRGMAKEFGYDMLLTTSHKSLPNDRREFSQKVIETLDDRIAAEHTCISPYGESTEITHHPIDTASTITKHHITDLASQMKHFLEWFPDPTGADYSHFQAFREKNDPYGASGISIHIPGFQNWIYFIEGGVEALSMLWMDQPELLQKVREAQHNYYVQLCKEALKQKPDFIYSSNSGSLTLQSPTLVEEYSLPTLKEVTRLAKEAGVPTHLHSCGLSRWLVETFANQTDLSSIEPLEPAPMGDVDLHEVAVTLGDKITLAGNVHTIEVMQRGTPQDVKNAVKKCIEDAAPAKGFILMTADQCPPDTPDENLHAFVEAAREYGKK